MNNDEDLIADVIEQAEEIGLPEGDDEKPRLLIERSSPDRTVSALRDILRDACVLYDRGVPVRLVYDQVQRGWSRRR